MNDRQHMQFDWSYLRLSRTELRKLAFFSLALGMAFALVMLLHPRISPYNNLPITIACLVIGISSSIAFARSGAPEKCQRPAQLYLLPALATFLLGILTIFAFYKPMLEHFWMGYDEPVLLSIRTAWFDTYDQCCARPMAGLAAFIGNVFLPGQIESLLVVNAAERWLLALAVFLLVLVLIPEAKLFALSAGVFSVVNPTEVVRFMPGNSLPYVGALIFLFAAFSTFVLSYRIISRSLLLICCVLLGISFLHYETMLPLSIMGPLLLWLLPERPHRRLWTAAWLLTTLAGAIRFLIFFLATPLYQSNYSRRFTLSSLLDNFPILFKPVFKFVSPLYTETALFIGPMVIGAATLIVFIVLANLYPPPVEAAAYRKRMALAAAVSLAGVILAILPEISVVSFLRASASFDGDLTTRLEFFPGPFQSILWAAVIALTTSFLPHSRYFFAASVALVVTLSSLDSWQLQANKGTINRHLDFQVISNIFRTAAPIVQRSSPDSIIFFVIPDDKPSPLGFGYHPLHMSCLLFGRPAYAGHFSTEYGLRWRAHSAPSALDQPDNYFPVPATEKIVLLFVHADGRVTEMAAPARTGTPTTTERTVEPNAMGRCSIPVAARRPDGDLPFLLPEK